MEGVGSDMTNWLVKTFIKNSDKVQNPTVRTQYGVLASIVGIFCNIILSVVKMVIGFMIGSISVTADAFNNLSDAASNIVSFVGVKLANRPADKEHPFGHGRYEYIAAFIVAFLVLQVGFTCLQNAIKKIINPEELNFQPLLVGILCLSILIKVWLGFFNRGLGKRINSGVLKATATDAFGDVIITTATVVALIIGELSGLNIDGYMGLIVSAFVLYAGFNIAKETLEPLLGEAVTPEVYQKITNKVLSYQNVVGCHDLIVHNYGPTKTMATIHVEVPKTMEMVAAHDLIDKIERDILRQMNIFLVIHMDPIELDNKMVNQLKKLVQEVMSECDSNASLHDFRVVNGEEHISIIFDLEVPHEYSLQQEEQLVKEIVSRMEEKDSRYQCIITLEHGFVAH